MTAPTLSPNLVVAGAPRLSLFLEQVQTTFQMFARTLSGYIAQLRDEPGYVQRAEHLVTLAYSLGERVGLSEEDVLEAYAEFCLTFLREQAEFLKTGEYRNAARGFEAVKHEVYEDDEYMGHYMLGHLLSCAVFPHHYRQYALFVDRFLPSVSDTARVFEFGCGHGMWISTFLAAAVGRQGAACDISPQCVVLAKAMVELQNIAPLRCELQHADAISYPLNGEYEAMIASGLLEHLEDPWTFLDRIRPHLAPKVGRLFTMVPTNTAHPDHLVLFSEVREIQEMYRDAGYAIVEERILRQDDPEVERSAVPSFLHLGILERAR